MNSKTIFLIDDSEPDQYLWKYIIQELDDRIQVLQAYDGQEALDLLLDTQIKPDVILLDLNMPGMDGFEFLENYSDKFQNDHSTIIIFSSSEQPKDQEKAAEFAFVKSYFIKPITKEKITDFLQKIIGGIIHK